MSEDDDDDRPQLTAERPQPASPVTVRRMSRAIRLAGRQFAAIDFRNRTRLTAPLVVEESSAYHESFTRVVGAAAPRLRHPLRLPLSAMKKDMRLRTVSRPQVNAELLPDRLFAQRARLSGCPVTGDRRLAAEAPPSHPEIAHFAREYRCGKTTIILHAAISFEDGLFFFDLSDDWETGMESLLTHVAQCYKPQENERPHKLRLLIADPMPWLKEDAFLDFLERYPLPRNLGELSPAWPLFHAVAPLRAAIESRLADELEAMLRARRQAGSQGVFLITRQEMTQLENALRRIGRTLLAHTQLNAERWTKRA